MKFLNRFKRKPTVAEEKPVDIDDDASDMSNSDMIIVMEHERFRVDLGWSHRNLEVGDPKRYTSKLHQSTTALEPTLPVGWEYVGGEWTLEIKDDHAGSQPFVRRRRWVRMVRCTIQDDGSAGDDDVIDSQSTSGDLSAQDENNLSETMSLPSQPGPSTLGANDFDEDEYDEEEEDNEDFEKAVIEINPSLKDKARVIRDPQLSAIGRQMKVIEDKCLREDEAKMREWNKRVAPTYKTTIKELDKRIGVLRKRIKSEIGVGHAHVAALEEELQAHLEVQDSTKRNLYFPNSAVTLGSSGVYFALDDFWLELASGQFIVDLVPSKDTPQVILLLTGTTDGSDSGVSVRLKIGGFKLKGDSGKGIPRIFLDSVKVTVTIRVTIMLTYNVKSQKWLSSAQNFKVEMIKFKGPFGLSRSVVAGVLSIVVPILRSQLLTALPPELGMFISTMPSPLSVRGEFNIVGTELKNLTHPLYKCADMCNYVGYTPEQLLMFVALQKSIDRKPLKTMDEFLKYRKLGTTHHKHWDEIRVLWTQAAVIYHDKLVALGGEDDPGIDAVPLSFEKILQGTDEILRNPLRVKFTLHNCDGQISIRSLLDNTQLFFERWRNSKTSKNQDIGQFVMLIQKFSQALDMARQMLTITNQQLDFIHLRVVLSLLAGPAGELAVTVNDVVAQAPLAVWAAMPSELSFGFEAPVPFVITVCPQEDGSIDISLFHCGSKQIQYRSRFKQWREDEESTKQTVDDHSKVKTPVRRRHNSGGAADEMSSRYLAALDVSNTKPELTNAASENTEAIGDVAATTTPHISDILPTGNGKQSERPSPSPSPIAPQRIISSAHMAVQRVISSEQMIVQRDTSCESLEPFLERSNHSDSLTEVSTDATQLQPQGSALLGRSSSADIDDSCPTAESPGLETLAYTRSLFMRGASVNKMNAPSPVSVGGSTRRRSLRRLNSGDLSHGGKSYKTDASSEASTQYTAQSFVPSQPVKIRQTSEQQISASVSEKQRRALEKTLCGRPKPLEAQRILVIKAVKPHVSVIVDKPITLKPGAELFTFRVGPLEEGWKPFGYTADQSCAHMRMAHPPGVGGDGAENREEGDECKAAGQLKSDGPKVPVPQLIQMPGCPMLLQTSQHVKVLAQIPNVQINFYLATLLRYLSLYFEDIDILRAYLGITSDRAKEAVEEYIYLFKILVDRLGKYLLLPNMSLSANIAVKVVASEEDVHISFETNMQDRGDGNTQNSASTPCAIKLGMRVYVMDVISDAIAIKNSLLRCAAVLERHIAEDAEAAHEVAIALADKAADHLQSFDQQPCTASTQQG